ncbi:MAG TPA: hypothetical protein VNG33_17130 [Polyangiaceae bacterium]|nr:hypothetical protein [Polyangiaceae bacterium]
MNDVTPADLTRDRILQLLAEGEVEGASIVETTVRLANGDEYLDLEQLQHGVQRARGAVNPLGRVLSRKAVHEDTWRRIVRQLKAAT